VFERLTTAVVVSLVFTGALFARNGKVFTDEGIASHYGKEWQGRKTASGEPLDNNALTAAHPALPFGTKVMVTLLKTGKSVVVRINDRGPFVKGRIIDLSDRAAREIGLDRYGIARVRIETIE